MRHILKLQTTLLLISLSLFSAQVFAIEIPKADNFKASYAKEGLQESGQRKIVMLLVSQPNCSYCDQISEEIIRPMIRSGQYQQTTIFRELKINAGQSITDFSGKQVTANRFARRYNAWATPTLLFLGPSGEELSAKMLGINTLELYGYYVDKSLKSAYSSLNP